MFSEQEIQNLKKALPTRAAYDISEQTGISRSTIYKFFNGGKVRTYCAQRIFESALLLVEQAQITAGTLKAKCQLILNEDQESYNGGKDGNRVSATE
ncbi:MAG: hypothetical protein KDD36_04385 [Flavobacteriales bacterium]|nr:hypothetical protein [Flavobacteriales bacterium]